MQIERGRPLTLHTFSAVQRTSKRFICLICAFALAFACVPAGFSYAAPQDRSDGSGKTIHVGYYSGDTRFQNGFSDDERKYGFAYDYYQEIAPYVGWNYVYSYGTRQEMINALINGDVDIVAGVSHTDNLPGTVLFSSRDMGLEGDPIYFAVSADRPDILADLDSAMNSIQEQSPKFVVDTMQKYYATDYVVQTLSEEEQEWLARKGTLIVGYRLDNLPISGEDASGNPSGVAAEIILAMETYLGVEVETRGFVTQAEALEALEAEQIDLILPTYADPWVTETRGIYQSAPFVTDRVMIVFAGDYDGSLGKIAIYDAGLGQSNFIAVNYPDSEVVKYPTREEMFKAVRDGEVDVALGPASVLTRFMAAHSNYEDFQSAYLDGNEYYAIGSRQSEPILAQALNKLVLQLDATQMNNSMIRYSYVEPSYSFIKIFQRYSVAIVLFLLVIFIALAYVFYSYRKRVAAFNEEQRESRLALEEALTAASGANDAKTVFLSSMSHDIRTPLNGIIGMTALAAVNIDDRSRVEDYLSKIASSGKHLLALINEILDVSKIESGKLEFNEEVFSLSDMIDDLVTINKPLADAKGLVSDLHIENVTHELVYGDVTRLQQVYTNLVNNAIKYTPEGGSIDITFSEKPSGSPTIGRYDFVVKDTGIGMSEEFLPSIFDAFARADDKAAVKQQGSGLGMPIALNIARMMNGDITVQSELGKGSTFTATVFLKYAQSDPVSYEEFIDLNVLVVDDDEDTCLYACSMLDSLGMVSEYATSGPRAIDMVELKYNEQDGYFAVIVDWIMPGMDGLETVKQIRARVPEDVPIIIISAYDWSEIEYEAREAGVQYFVGKPLFKSRLAQLFSQILGESGEEDLSDLVQITEVKPLEGKRALLAEDNELNAEIAINFFNMAGMELERAVNGKEAVDMFEAAGPGYYDCIFMDIQMPVMNGYEAAEAIRGLGKQDAKTIPIFAMTADAFVDDVKKAANAGMNEHFAKPLDFEKVIARVSEYLR